MPNECFLGKDMLCWDRYIHLPSLWAILSHIQVQPCARRNERFLSRYLTYRRYHCSVTKLLHLGRKFLNQAPIRINIYLSGEPCQNKVTYLKCIEENGVLDELGHTIEPYVDFSGFSGWLQQISPQQPQSSLGAAMFENAQEAVRLLSGHQPHHEL